MRVRLLGPVTIARDGGPVVLGGGRRTAVFTALALQAGHAVTRDELIAAVWGEDPPVSATGSLYTYVSDLRAALGPDRDVLSSGGGTYTLLLPPDAIDVTRFEALREQARRHRTDGDPTAEAAELDAALRLWAEDAPGRSAGGLLPDAGDTEPLAGVPGPFAAAERDRLTELRRVTMDRRAALNSALVRPGMLDDREARALAQSVAPEPLGPDRLRRLIADAGGHAGYVRALATGADLQPVTAAHLAPLAPAARQALRTIATLTTGTGTGECDLGELSTATALPREELDTLLAPAVAAGVLTRSGDRVAFRAPVAARTLHDGAPVVLRVMLHRTAAERLAAAGASPERVAAQYLNGRVPFDAPVRAWLLTVVARLSAGAPGVALSALQRAGTELMPEDDRLHLTAWTARVQHRLHGDTIVAATWVATRTTDRDLEAEMRWLIARTHERRGSYESAAEVAHAVFRERTAPPAWLDRFHMLLARVRPALPGRATDPDVDRDDLPRAAQERPLIRRRVRSNPLVPRKRPRANDCAAGGGG
ncbi:AfsR/SARP family transcriptional regulator [Catenuloplanes japonicus]|uniref:AfsR/SARP family transcriptional regulator n=1 Tax=Catenuloplanes japonicus TaxID=33876 RepID=UPI0005267B9B|nr:winged helix-turn-helix domain-containing protein [Catenuloplanes japonicus]